MRSYLTFSALLSGLSTSARVKPGNEARGTPPWDRLLPVPDVHPDTVDLSYLEESARNASSPIPEAMEAQTTPKITRASLLKAKPLRPTTAKQTPENSTTAETRILGREGEGGIEGGREGQAKHL